MKRSSEPMTGRAICAGASSTPSISIPTMYPDSPGGGSAYVWRDLINAGVVIANGTDVPVEDADPIANFHASIGRIQNDGQVFFADQRMTREEALRSQTLDAAYAAFEENVKGSLTPGKYADVVVLSRNIMTIPEGEILSAKVDYTILGGKVVFEREGR